MPGSDYRSFKTLHYLEIGPDRTCKRKLDRYSTLTQSDFGNNSITSTLQEIIIIILSEDNTHDLTWCHGGVGVNKDGGCGCSSITLQWGGKNTRFNWQQSGWIDTVSTSCLFKVRLWVPTVWSLIFPLILWVSDLSLSRPLRRNCLCKFIGFLAIHLLTFSYLSPAHRYSSLWFCGLFHWLLWKC